MNYNYNQAEYWVNNKKYVTILPVNLFNSTI